MVGKIKKTKVTNKKKNKFENDENSLEATQLDNKTKYLEKIINIDNLKNHREIR